jgi:hypothetical protein
MLVAVLFPHICLCCCAAAITIFKILQNPIVIGRLYGAGNYRWILTLKNQGDIYLMKNVALACRRNLSENMRKICWRTFH